MRYTEQYLKSLGYAGYQCNTFTGNTLAADYPLRHIAYAANHNPKKLGFVRNPLTQKVRVSICDLDSNIEIYIERPMTAEEMRQEEEKLAKMGWMIVRN